MVFVRQRDLQTVTKWLFSWLRVDLFKVLYIRRYDNLFIRMNYIIIFIIIIIDKNWLMY